jgi:hypothetical protein
VVADVNGVLSIDPAPPSSCTGFLILSVEEYDAFSAASWWNGLTLDDGAAISGAILAVWAVGWAIRQVARVLFIEKEKEDV